MKIINFSLILIFLIISALNAAPVNVGTTGSTFLKIGYGARPSGMGGAFASISGDISSLYWNPSGIYGIKNDAVSFMYLDWFAGINYNFISYVKPLKKGRGVIGFGIASMNYGDIPGTIEKAGGFDLTGSFKPYDRLIQFSYANPMKVMEYTIPVGINVKFISQKIGKEMAQGFAIDIGGQYDISENWRAGVVLQNLGKLSKFADEKDNLPLNLKLGVSHLVLENKLLLSCDINLPQDNVMFVNFGAEYYLYSRGTGTNFGLRTGYNNLDSDRKGWALGFGANISKFDFDYAFVPFSDLGNTHKISLNYNFGPIEEGVVVVKSKPEPEAETKKKEKLSPEEDMLQELLKNGYSKYILYRDPNAKSVAIIGDFSDWEPIELDKSDKYDIWYCELYLKPGRYLYKLIVNHKVVYDKSNYNKEPDGMFGYKSVLYISEEGE